MEFSIKGIIGIKTGRLRRFSVICENDLDFSVNFVYPLYPHRLDFR